MDFLCHLKVKKLIVLFFLFFSIFLLDQWTSVCDGLCSLPSPQESRHQSQLQQGASPSSFSFHVLPQTCAFSTRSWISDCFLFFFFPLVLTRRAGQQFSSLSPRQEPQRERRVLSLCVCTSFF